MSEFQFAQSVISIQIFDPFIGLLLWINTQRISFCFSGQNTVFAGYFIIWKTCDIPVSNNDRVTHNGYQVEVFISWDFSLEAAFNPLFDQDVSVLSSEGTEIRDTSTGQEDVTNEFDDLFTNDLDCFLPTDSFILKKND